MAIKLTTEHVKREFEKAGWQLHTLCYERSQQKLDVTCPKGHRTNITWNNFQRGQGCGFCSGRFKYTIEMVNKIFENAGYKCVATEYVNNSTPIPFLCNNGHENSIRLADFLNGSRCSNCKGLKLSEVFRAKEDEIIEVCEAAGAKLLSFELKKGKTFIYYECKNGHKSSAYLTNFKRHFSCWECSKVKKAGENCYRWNPNRQYIKKIKLFRKSCHRMVRRILKLAKKGKESNCAELLGYTAVELQNHIENHPNMSSCIGKKWHIDHVFPIKAFFDYGIEDLKIINCLENLQPLTEDLNLEKSGNYDFSRFEEWLKTKGITYNKELKKEIEINEIILWLTSLNVESKIENNIIVSSNLRIHYVDFLSESNNIELYNNAKKYKQRLITIFFDEWHHRKEQCKNFIKSVLGLNKYKVYGRECLVKEISPLVGRDFLKSYHIQGSNRLGIVFFGIYFNDELLGVTSLGRHNRQNGKKECIVLDRLCFKDDYQILGGASKLFKKCIEWAKVNNYKSIFSFSDNRWSDGHIYNILGFILDKEYGQDYSYVSLNGTPRRLSKQSQRKKAVSCPEGLTEGEWAKKRGLSRIYDCGKKRWRFDIM